jgi:hypothetical protein
MAYTRRDEEFRAKLEARAEQKRDTARAKNTYYRIWKYLVDSGLSKGKAHYVRNLVRELVHDTSVELAERAYAKGVTDGIARKAEENVRRKLK